jgi:hypothetical protein
MRAFRSLAPLVASLAAVTLAACGATNVQSPNAVMRAYAAAVIDGRADAAYALLSDDAKRSMSLEAFRQILQTNREEAIEIGQSLARPTSDPYVTATVTLPSHETITLVLEDGVWRVDGSAIDFYSQATPRLAMIAFIRAFERDRFDVLMKLSPAAHREGLTQERLRDAWGRVASDAKGDAKSDGKIDDKAPRRPEGAKIAEKLDVIASKLPTATIEETGAAATLSYDSGVVKFVRENGVWLVEDL